MNNKPVHATSIFPTINNQLMVAGKSLAEWAKVTNSTPFFIYDGDRIYSRIKEIRDTFPAAINLHYAIKANPLPALVEDISQLVDGLDVASEGELALALQTQINPAHISIAGPAKSAAELEMAIMQGLTINVESSRELDNIVKLAKQSGHRPRVALRINPDFELKSAGMKMGGRSTAFGVDVEQAPALLQAMGNRDVDFVGLHVFPGSQNLHAQHLIEAQQATFALASNLVQYMPQPMRSFNIGGGFGIPYFPGEQPLKLQIIADNLKSLMEQYSDTLGSPTIILELGRYLVGEAGVYVCKIIDRKVSRGKTWLVADGGLHHHLAASGNLGQIIRKNYPVLPARQHPNRPNETVSIAGPLCTPLDLLAENHEINQILPGELIAVLQSGAYAYSASPKDFLSRNPAREFYVPGQAI